jgi:hypothetical protein
MYCVVVKTACFKASPKRQASGGMSAAGQVLERKQMRF